jgi:Mrp family chromosome partitioning ATPase
MVASAVSGEGKTFTSVNLCLSIAREKDWNVVLVDGDCGKPQLTRMFGAEREPGLLDLLSGESNTFDSLVMPTNLPNLSFLPNGRRDPHAAELFSSVRMERLCAELNSSDPQRMIVFDSAPLLMAAESAVLATRVGQILLVVKAFGTPSHSVVEACDKLDSSKAINLLLNQASYQSNPHWDAGYGSYGSYEDAAV